MFELRSTPCAVTKSDWEKDKNNFTCKISTNVYHCIQDEKNRSGEMCTQSVWVPSCECIFYFLFKLAPSFFYLSFEATKKLLFQYFKRN